MPFPLAQAAPDSAVSTVWDLQTRWPWAPGVTLALLLVIAVVVALCYRYEVSPAGSFYRGLLGLLRLTTIALLLVMLSEAVLSGRQTGKPRLAIVLDRSESMQRADLGERAPPGTTREEAARSLLLDDGGKLLKRLGREYNLQLAAVDAAVEVLPGDGPALLAWLSASDPESPDRSSTRLGDALFDLIESPSVAPLQAVLLLTDGQSTDGRPLAEAAEAARRTGAPLYFVGLGSESPPPALRLSDLVADETVFVDDPVRIQATLHAAGLTGKPVRVELFREGDETPLASQRVAPGEDAIAGSVVRLVDRPTEAGTVRYRIRARVEGNDRSTDSPESVELSHTLVVRDEPIKVLLAAGYPNYEYRFLKSLFERDSTIALRTHLQEADPDYVSTDETALGRMPVDRERIGEYDVVVLVDLDPSLLPRSLWESMGEFVAERGGGLVLVSGPRSLPSSYRERGAFVALCPTDLEKASPGGWSVADGFRPMPTPLGRQEAALELSDSPAENELVWRELPAMYWRADVGPAKPAARVLADLPGAELTTGAPAPLIVSHYFGAGRVTLHAFDGSWRWRFRVGDVFFARYWVQTIRSLARGKFAEDRSKLELSATRTRYEPGEPVRLRLNDRRPTAGREATRTVLLRPEGRADQEVEMRIGAGGRGRYQATLNGLPAGRYRAVYTGADKPVAAEFEVVAPPGEGARPEMDRAEMTAAAERTRGAFFTLAEASDLAQSLPPARPATLEALPPYELWNRWPLLAAITCCLCAEWILRKRRSML